VTSTPILARAALFTGVSTLVPIPFADEWVLVRARKDMTAALLRARGRTYAVEDVAPLYEEPSGSWLLLPFRLAGKLVLVPVRMALRTVFFVFAARAVALQVGKTLVLGATIDRLLGQGMLATPSHDEARRVRAAFEATYAGSDVRALKDAVAAALRTIKGKPSTTKESVAAALVRSEPAPADAQSEVEHVLDEPAVQGFLAEFARRFDAALAAAR
jgi:uncharacterized protein (DUF697 family)